MANPDEFVRIREDGFDASVSRAYAESIPGLTILEGEPALDARRRPLPVALKGERRVTNPETSATTVTADASKKAASPAAKKSGPAASTTPEEASK